jgi:hypothetical protein
MRQHGFSYQAALRASLKVKWQVEDLIGGDRVLDFSRPFLPDSLAATAALPGLDRRAKLLLNQIRGHNYLYLFGLVEEFILPFLLDHVRNRLDAPDVETRALLNFAAEEAKHIDLFKRFRAAFQAGFGHGCQVIGPPEAIAEAVLVHHPLSVALTILHIEWMTQRHYLDSVRGDNGIDPCFKDLLAHHWMEEAQHARLDTLLVEELAWHLTAAEIAEAVDGYVAITRLLGAGLLQQVEFDLAALQAVLQAGGGREIAAADLAQCRFVQQAAMNWTFLGSGMSHPMFRATLSGISREGAARIDALAAIFGRPETVVAG